MDQIRFLTACGHVLDIGRVAQGVGPLPVVSPPQAGIPSNKLKMAVGERTHPWIKPDF